MSEWHAYVAGFMDGEGSVTLARQRQNGKSDYHLVRIVIVQRAKHRAVLDRIAEEFGGYVRIRRQTTRISKVWAETALWELQDKPSILRFLQAMQPYCIVKAPQVALALEFLETFVTSRSFRDDLGRVHGYYLTADEIERRERLRLKMRALNANGPPKAPPSQLPPLDMQVRRREEAERTGNRLTISRGEGRPLAKLNDDDVRAIRLLYDATPARPGLVAELARAYGVSYMTMSKVVHRKTWKHVEQIAADAPAFSQPTLFDGAI